MRRVDIKTGVVTTFASSMPKVRTAWMDVNSTIYAGTDNGVIYARGYSATGDFSIIAGQESGSTTLQNGVGTNARFGSILSLTGDTGIH